MKKRINFYETVMKCSAEQVGWRGLDEITDKADDFPKYYGNYFNDEESSVYALFGLGSDRYCVMINRSAYRSKQKGSRNEEETQNKKI